MTQLRSLNSTLKVLETSLQLNDNSRKIATDADKHATVLTKIAAETVHNCAQPDELVRSVMHSTTSHLPEPKVSDSALKVRQGWKSSESARMRHVEGDRVICREPRIGTRRSERIARKAR